MKKAIDQVSASTKASWDWSKNIDPAFLLAQQTLTIFLKDGYSFFKAHAETLTRRFSDFDKSTQILIVNPDSPFMAAVANMDEKKRIDPESQKSDCKQAIKALQNIRDKIFDEEDIDCSEWTVFKGHRSVPTWNGFVGDNIVIANIYPSRPYRGPLLSLQSQRDSGADNGMLWEWAVKDCTALASESTNLWNYQLPDPLPDLRR